MAVRETWRKTAIVTCSALLSLAVIYSAAREYLAERNAARFTAPALQRAIGLESGNASYRFALGSYLESQQDLAGAIAQYRSALALNQYSARYWLSLSRAYMQNGDTEGFVSALGQAGKVAPNDLEVSWETGNWRLVVRDVDGAFEAFRKVVEAEPTSERQVLDVCWRATKDPTALLRVVPHIPVALMAYLQWAAMSDLPEAGNLAWGALRSSEQPFDAMPALVLVNVWLGHGRVAEAKTIWRQVSELAPQLKSYAAGDNLVVNPGFDLDLLNTGFDWRIVPANPAVMVAVDRGEFKDGDSSLQITLDGMTAEPLGIWQTVPVRAATNYSVSFFTRTRDLITSSGVRLLVVDFRTKKPLFLSDDALGTTGWHEAKGTFITPADAEAVEVRLARVPADKPVKGKVWIDRVSITQQ